MNVIIEEKARGVVWEIHQARTNRKKAGFSCGGINYKHKINFKTRNSTRYKVGHFIKGFNRSGKKNFKLLIIQPQNVQTSLELSEEMENGGLFITTA